MDIEEIVTKTIDCAMNVRKYFGEGYLERVYPVPYTHLTLRTNREV